MVLRCGAACRVVGWFVIELEASVVTVTLSYTIYTIRAAAMLLMLAVCDDVCGLSVVCNVEKYQIEASPYEIQFCPFGPL